MSHCIKCEQLDWWIAHPEWVCQSICSHGIKCVNKKGVCYGEIQHHGYLGEFPSKEMHSWKDENCRII